jgi:hypothetical protein
MKRRFLGYAKAAAFVAMLVFIGSTIRSVANSGRELQARLLKSISGEVTSIEARNFTCCAKDSWRQLQPLQGLIAIIRQAEVALPPGHAQAKQSVLLRITARRGEVSEQYCFVASQYIGAEDKTYIGNIEPQKGCDSTDVKWGAGGVRFPNILH